MINDGWHDEAIIEEAFINDEEDDLALINEFYHVIRYQSKGNFRTIYQPVFSDKMALEMVKHVH